VVVVVDLDVVEDARNVYVHDHVTTTSTTTFTTVGPNRTALAIARQRETTHIGPGANAVLKRRGNASSATVPPP